MISFASDYIYGCHPRILERLTETNNTFFKGYGADDMTVSATEKIREAIGRPDAVVRFISGGTQTNQLAIDTMIDRSEGVVCADTGHIAVHEAGAIEYVGRKVMTVPAHDGKMDPDELENFVKLFYADGNQAHMVYPGMVYISFPTELGTLYTLDELKRISAVCKKYDMVFYIDGARLGYGLAASTDVTIRDIAALTDAFYIGGTKIGAMYGEALIFTHNNEPKRFETYTKKHGALLAKGWLCALQFDTLFTDDLYMKISENAITQAKKMRDLMVAAGFPVYQKSPTNQQFFIIENSILKKMEEWMVTSFWEPHGDHHTVIRMATSFATTDEHIEELAAALKTL